MHVCQIGVYHSFYGFNAFPLAGGATGFGSPAAGVAGRGGSAEGGSFGPGPGAMLGAAGHRCLGGRATAAAGVSFGGIGGLKWEGDIAHTYDTDPSNGPATMFFLAALHLSKKK